MFLNIVGQNDGYLMSSRLVSAVVAFAVNVIDDGEIDCTSSGNKDPP